MRFVVAEVGGQIEFRNFFVARDGQPASWTYQSAQQNDRCQITVIRTSTDEIEAFALKTRRGIRVRSGFLIN